MSEFTPNDYVTIVLTEHGADLLNAKGRHLNDAFPKQPMWRTDFKEGDEVRDQFWSVVGDFSECWRAGAAMPFSDLRLGEAGK